ncbi:hypothetical protein BU17DRAFT_84292 [Hysterangium stoloniferum]|nr:hypothetical protein BU17DRAFT_84292 [Hysterangium stoloniferum]
MAQFTDVLYLVVTLAVLGGSVTAILLIVNRVSEFKTTTKEKLKSRGYNVSDSGVSVKTSKRLDHEGYVDATQRNFIKAFNASSFGTPGAGTSSTSKNAEKAPESKPSVRFS